MELENKQRKIHIIKTAETAAENLPNKTNARDTPHKKQNEKKILFTPRSLANKQKPTAEYVNALAIKLYDGEEGRNEQ